MDTGSNWNGTRVVILGAARQGTALARYLALLGARVTINDLRSTEQLESARLALADIDERVRYPLEWVLGSHPTEILEDADLLCVSGGVPLSLPVVVEAQKRGIPLTNDSQIFLENAPCRVVGITGSAGKTTTTTLVGRMAQAAVDRGAEHRAIRRAWVGGNIGLPLIGLLEEMSANDLVIMELSSFQLELMTRSPQVAAVLNITPNHLDRHGSMQAYTAAKRRILEYQNPGDVAVLGRDDPGAWHLVESVRGRLVSFGMEAPGKLEASNPMTYAQAGQLYYQAGAVHASLMPRSIIRLRGEHNLLNVLAASAVALAADLTVEAIQAGVQGFTGVAHRLEYVRTWKGADWYNDSIATAPERSMAAVRSFDEPLVLLLGGRDKDLPWESLVGLVCQRVDQLVVFGEAAEKIMHAFARSKTFLGAECRTKMVQVEGLSQAVEAAARVVRPGDVVLLSPGGTSFDEFVDFEERGECFKQLVMQL
jgi:UDP-N-acetylmuramoylalanine--D-glutamate ligase